MDSSMNQEADTRYNKQFLTKADVRYIRTYRKQAANR
jgi:hypothetical protein